MGDRFGNRVSGFGWGAKIINEDDLVCYFDGEVVWVAILYGNNEAITSINNYVGDELSRVQQ